MDGQAAAGDERMTDVADRPSVHFDHHSAEFAAAPWPILEDMRDRCPVAHSDAYGGFWVLTRYEDIRTVALDDETFSSAQSIVIPAKQNASQPSIPIETDPPIFHEYRRVMQPLFSPTAVDRLEPAIESFVTGCIDEFIEAGLCDFVHDLADPLPALTTLHKLGLPLDDWARFAEPLHKTVFLRQGDPARAGVMEQLAWIRQVIVDAVADRRRHPRDDMITYLVNATVDGRPIESDEVVAMIVLTIQGGFDTTGSAIGNALLYLDADRDARRRLIEDPALIPSAVEELLRFEAPQFALARVATRDVEIGGQHIAAGERILLVWASGNRDETVFSAPNEVVLERSPNRHMTFGLGAHRCLGSTLARREILVALRAVLRRMPDYEIHYEQVVRAQTIGVAYGSFSLPARFTPGPRHHGSEGRADWVSGR
jgi:cytochrome P450